ncbi:hypothetical protein K443DRAFT_114101, partial [Laccaria amethystina LaAM-08-1]
VDCSGLQWIPVALLPDQIGWWNAQSSPVQSMEVQWTESPVRVQWIPLESTGLSTEL